MINLAEKYSSKIDEIINNGALSESGVNKEYDFVGAQTVKVYSFGTADMNDYKASGDNRYGTPAELEDSLQEMTMSRKRSFTFTIDKTNAVDSPEGVRDAAKALRRQLDLKVIPEIDTYRFAKMADNAGFKYFTAVSSTTAYSAFAKANCDIDNAEMPVEGRIAFATAEFINAVKTDSNFVKSSDIAQNMLIKNQFGEIDGVRIIKVPASRMPAGACFIITNPIATTAPVKLSDYKVHQDPPGLAGNLVEGLTYYDAFVLNNKKKCIAVSYGALGELSVAMAAAGSGAGVVTVSGNKNGGKLVYKTASSVTAATLGSDVSGWAELPADGKVTATSGHKIAVAVSVDGKAVAASPAVTVTVG